MKRNVLQMVLGLAAMAVVLVGLESQANAFGHRGGSCGSHGGQSAAAATAAVAAATAACSVATIAAADRCGDRPAAKEAGMRSCGCGREVVLRLREQLSTAVQSGCGRHHRHHGGGCDSGCNSGCESSCGGGESSCSDCEAAKDENAAPAAPRKRKHGRRNDKREKRLGLAR